MDLHKICIGCITLAKIRPNYALRNGTDPSVGAKVGHKSGTWHPYAYFYSPNDLIPGTIMEATGYSLLNVLQEDDFCD